MGRLIRLGTASMQQADVGQPETRTGRGRSFCLPFAVGRLEELDWVDQVKGLGDSGIGGVAWGVAKKAAG